MFDYSDESDVSEVASDGEQVHESTDTLAQEIKDSDNEDEIEYSAEFEDVDDRKPVDTTSKNDDNYDDASFEDEEMFAQPIAKNQSYESNQVSEQLHHPANIYKTTKLNVELSNPIDLAKLDNNVLSSGNVLGNNSKAFIGLQELRKLEGQVDAITQSSFSLLLKKVESKFEKELEQLREDNALLSWKERELKADLREHKMELKARKARLERKKKRAISRRELVEQEISSLKFEVSELQLKLEDKEEELAAQTTEKNKLTEQWMELMAEKSRVEQRNMTLSDQLQTTLSDFHQLNLKYESAVNAKLESEAALSKAIASHKTDKELWEQKCRLELQSVEAMLVKEREDRTADRTTLPETHRLIVENEKHKYEAMAAMIKKQLRDMEDRLARETATHEQALTHAIEGKRRVLQQTDERLQRELQTIMKERDTIDAHRRELLQSVTTSQIRIDQERGKLDALRQQLDKRERMLTDKEVEVETKQRQYEQDSMSIVETQKCLESRKNELVRLEKETFEKTQEIAKQKEKWKRLEDEIHQLRQINDQLTSQDNENKKVAMELARERKALEKTAVQLQHDRLIVTKQRIQSKQLLADAKKYEILMEQQHLSGKHKSANQVSHLAWEAMKLYDQEEPTISIFLKDNTKTPNKNF